jgi:hypothetical protein
MTSDRKTIWVAFVEVRDKRDTTHCLGTRMFDSQPTLSTIYIQSLLIIKYMTRDALSSDPTKVIATKFDETDTLLDKF